MPRFSHIPAVASAILAINDADPKALITNAALVQKTSKDARTITGVLTTLVKKGALKKEGARHDAKYKVVKSVLKPLAA